MADFSKIYELQAKMYASKEWKSGKTIKAVENYLKDVRENVPLRTFYDYRFFVEDNMYAAQSDVYYSTKEAFPDFTKEQFLEWWKVDLAEWEKLNGYA